MFSDPRPFREFERRVQEGTSLFGQSIPLCSGIRMCTSGYISLADKLVANAFLCCCRVS